MDKTKITSRLGTSVERCNNNCGFAASSNWGGYCSTCYKEKFGSLDVPLATTTSSKPVKESRKYLKNLKSIASEKPQTPKREESKSKVGLKLPRTKITITSPNKDSATTEVKTVQRNTFSSLDRVSIPFQEVTGQLNELLSSVKRSQAQDIVDSTKAFMTQFQSPDCVVYPDETVKKIQNYFLAMSYSLYNTDIYKSLSLNTKDSLFLALENYVITHVYKSIFCLPSTDDEFLDSSLRRQMLSLSWTTTENIDCHLQLDKTEVKHALQLCKEEIWSLDKRYTPRQKLTSIVSLSKHIMNALHCSQGHAASADDFLPALIFILIQSAPPFLASNIRFIERFAPADLINSGESAYYFTNFLGAVNFLENVSCDKLKHVTPELFDEMAAECIRREVGFEEIDHDEIHGHWDIINEIGSAIIGLEHFNQKQTQLLKSAFELREEIQAFRLGIQSQVNSIIEQPLMTSLRREMTSHTPVSVAVTTL
eukprot:TRINITY_DN8200_c0_g1_i1.p1 TRINITY_DN8200_c0_g1~~TRINITY_DN8200_c0_g1_i1.p1  ORF type:complete len:481 (+),score=142.95 TRINITY_DN8200_c0_g1_i1:142-1584(+)